MVANNIDQDNSVLLIIWHWYILIIFFRNYIALGGKLTQFQDDKDRCAGSSQSPGHTIQTFPSCSPCVRRIAESI